MKEIARGAEAIIYLDKDKIIKHRIEKDYRIKELDNTLRKSRTRRETKILEKLSIPHPKLINSDDITMKIEMDYIDGEKLRDVFDVKHCRKIGEYVGMMHNENIIHGDLTTSNMILKCQKSKISEHAQKQKEFLTEDEIYFIDFGLSFFSNKIEDRAVDLHLLKEALESKHYKVADKAFKEIISGYKKTNKESKEVLERLEKVEARGRNKHK